MDFVSLLSNNTFIVLTLIWTLPWKGVALWKASRNEEKWWFVAILLTNTFALLDVLYIFYFSKRKERGKKGQKKEKAKTAKGDSSDTSAKSPKAIAQSSKAGFRKKVVRKKT